MPQDVSCPKCKHAFPVAETRQAFGVQCPSCDVEFTAEFRKVVAPAPGQAPYELLARSGKTAGVVIPEGKKRKDDEDDEEKKGGSMTMVVVVALSALLITLGGLGTIGYFLFTNTDTTQYVSGGSGNRPNNNPSGGGFPKINPGGGGGGNKGGNPIIQQPPPKPKSEMQFTEQSFGRFKFTAKFPAKPREELVNTTTTAFTVEVPNGMMRVVVEDVKSPAKMTQTEATSALDAATSRMLRGFAGTVKNTTPLSATGVGTNRVHRREVLASIGNPKPGTLRAKIHVTGTRVYQVMVVGTNDFTDSRDATTFLDGFRHTN